MADLSDIQAAESVKIVGSASSGAESTPVEATTNGALHINLRNNSGTEIGTTSNPVVVSGKVSPDTSAIPATYSAGGTAFTIPALSTDVFTITGGASKPVKITKIFISGIQTTSSFVQVFLVKRSSANSGGTSTTLTAVPHDSNNVAATATVRAYTVLPTLGTTVGTLRSIRLHIPENDKDGGGGRPLVLEFGQNDYTQPIVLRGTSEVLAINFGGVTITGNSLSFSIEWTEG